MKVKILLLIISITFVSLSVSAQIEIKGLLGVNASTVTNVPEYTDVKGKIGYQFGASVLIGQKFYIEPGIQFVRNSGEFNVEILDASYEFTVQENLVRIPVYLGYHLLGEEDSPLSLRAFAGPALSVLGKLKSDDEHDLITKDSFKDARWGINLGAGLDILFLFVEVNYEFGISKYHDLEDDDSKYNSLLVNAGVHFDF